MFNAPFTKRDYDGSLGVDVDEILEYINETNLITSRVSPFKFYLLSAMPSGSAIGTLSSPITIDSEDYVEITPYYRVQIWPKDSRKHPELSLYSQISEQDTENIIVLIDTVEATRVLDIEDLRNDDEYAVVKRRDLDLGRVELVFNAGFDASSHIIQFYSRSSSFYSIPELDKRGESPDSSHFGWMQYICAADAYHGPNQILVRYPMSSRDLVVNEEGRVELEQATAWMGPLPYVHDFDLLVIDSVKTPGYDKELFEVVSKNDSEIAGKLTSQRFMLRYLERTDPRYNISHLTTYSKYQRDIVIDSFSGWHFL